MKRVRKALAVLLVAVLVCALGGCGSKNKTDCTVAFILTGSYPEQFTEIIGEHLQQYAADTNGDGEAKVKVISFSPYSPTSLMAEFGYADSMIFITDAAPLEQINEKFSTILTPLNEDGGNSLPWESLPGLAALDWSEYPINVQGLEIETEQLEEWANGLQVCLRTIEGTDFAEDKQKIAEHQCAEALLNALREG